MFVCVTTTDIYCTRTCSQGSPDKCCHMQVPFLCAANRRGFLQGKLVVKTIKEWITFMTAFGDVKMDINILWSEKISIRLSSREENLQRMSYRKALNWNLTADLPNWVKFSAESEGGESNRTTCSAHGRTEYDWMKCNLCWISEISRESRQIRVRLDFHVIDCDLKAKSAESNEWNYI